MVTLDDDVPRGEALLLAGGRVVRVGSTADLHAHALGDIEELDVSGASVLPGFVDGHTHFEMTSTSIDQCINAHTPPCTSLADIAGVIRREIAHAADYPWLVCRSSFGLQNKVTEGQLFTRHELDRLASDRPLVVFAGLHVAMLNTNAMEALGLFEGRTVAA